jgi:hypothetical protein
MTEQTPAQPDAVPTRVDLEDFIEAAARGMARAWTAPDDIDGYLLRDVSVPSYSFGFVIHCRPPSRPVDPRVRGPRTVRDVN